MELLACEENAGAATNTSVTYRELTLGKKVKLQVNQGKLNLMATKLFIDIESVYVNLNSDKNPKEFSLT